MKGRWDSVHQGQEPAPYGDTTTYELATDWLKDCDLVEDWGCGLGWARRYFEPGQYRGLDGSQSPAVDEIVDLCIYRSQVPGLLLRHVLEHNFAWEQVLDNALASFTRRMVLILFTPMMEETQTIAWNREQGVPDIAFRAKDLEDRFDDLDWACEDLQTKTQYLVERIYYLEHRWPRSASASR